jgi:hypothetical protein
LRFVRAAREGRLEGGPSRGMGIGGGAPGINALLETGIGGYDLVVLTNLDPPAAMDVGRQVREWLGIRMDGGGARVIRRPPPGPRPGSRRPPPPRLRPR